MSFTQRIAIAGSFAFALLASGATTAGSAPVAGAVVSAPVQLAAAADATSASLGVESLRLTTAEMNAVQGDGFFKWLKKTVKKVDKWIKANTNWIKAVVEFIETLAEIFGDDDKPEGTITTEVHQNLISANEYFDSDADFNAGNRSGTDQSETGMQYQYTTVTGGGGGGGGGTCLQEYGCNAY